MRLILSLCLACCLPAIVQAQFVDVASSVGLANESSALGVAWGDFDADGDPDLYVTRVAENNSLYKNNNGVFIDVAVDMGVESPYESISATWADYDRDGDLDLFVINSKSLNRLYRNDGAVFTDVTEAQNIGEGSGSQMAAWGDFDGDLDLDLYVINSGEINRLYRNDGGRFKESVRTTNAYSEFTSPKVVSWVDFDRDRDLDLFYNTLRNPVLLRNDAGIFKDISNQFEFLVTNTNQSIWADYDSDGDPDLTLSNPGLLLYRNDGDAYTYVSGNTLLNTANRSESLSWIDFDCDADLDLYLSNLLDDPNRLFQNNNNTFTDVADAMNVAENAGNAGSAWADYDNDGDLDLFAVTRDGPDRLFQNQCNPAEGTYQKVILRTEGGGTSAHGMWVSLEDPANSEVYHTLEIGGASGAHGQSQYESIFNGLDPSVQYNFVAQFPNGYRFEDRIFPSASTIEVLQPDNDPPAMLDIFLSHDRSYLDIVLSERVFGDPLASTPVDLSNFAISLTDGTATNPVITSVTRPSDEPLQAGDTNVRVHFSFDGSVSNKEQLSLFPSSPIYDAAGNAMLADQPNAIIFFYETTFADVAPELGLVGENTNAVRSMTWGDVTGDLIPELISNEPFNVWKFAGTSAVDISASTSLSDLPGNEMSLVDFDADGDLDLFTSNLSSGDRLYQNDNGVMTIVGDQVGLPDRDSRAHDWGDFDGDEDLDLVLGGNVIFEYDGERYIQRGEDIGVMEESYSLPSWIDFDGDGDLDLMSFSDPTRLYRNDDGFFTDVASELNFDLEDGRTGSWGDYDNDGDLDFYLSESYEYFPILFRNDGTTFTDVTESVGLKVFNFSASGSWIDYDGDGWLDLYLNNIPKHVDRLYRNEGGHFVDIALALGLSSSAATGPSGWGDYDSDGDLDLYINNFDSDNQLLNNPNTPLPGTYFVIRPAYQSGSISAFGARVSVYEAGEANPFYSHVIVQEPLGTGENEYGAFVAFLDPAKTYDVEVHYPGGRSTRLEDVDTSTPYLYPVLPDIARPFFKRIEQTVGNVYVDVTFSEGIYGDLEGTLPVANSDFAFELSGGTATAISADSVSSISGASLQGGERAVRIYLSVEGRTNGKEVVLLKPANAAAMFDRAGNAVETEQENGLFTLYEPAFVNRTTEYALDEATAGGTFTSAWVDVDNDEQLDLLFSQESIVYVQDKDGFENTISPSQLILIGVGKTINSIAWGDFNRDGYVDAFLGRNAENEYYQNNGEQFVRIGVIQDSERNRKTLGAIPGDFNGDGDLDLFIANEYLPELLVNAGDTLINHLETSGIVGEKSEEIKGANWVDFDGDADLDLFVTTTGINRLYVNEAGSFTDQAGEFGLAEDEFSAGAAWADFDNDGDLDVYVVNGRGVPNNLFRNDGSSFVDVTDTWQVTDTDDSDSASWIDYDTDGDLDIFLVNDRSPDMLFKNEGGVFNEIGATVGLDVNESGWHAAWGDYDNDGDKDLFMGLQQTFFDNPSNPAPGTYLAVKPLLAPNAITVHGALLYLREAQSDSLVALRVLAGNDGHRSNHQYDVFFYNLDPGTTYTLDISYPGNESFRVEALTTDQTNWTIVLPDVKVPFIEQVDYRADGQLEVFFSEGVFGAGASPIEPTDLQLQLIDENGLESTVGVTFSTLKSASGDSLAGGEARVIIQPIFDGFVKGSERIRVVPASASSIFDVVGNAMSTAQTSNEVALNSRPFIFIDNRYTDRTHYDVGAHWVDYDGDQDLDLFVSNTSDRQNNVIFANEDDVIISAAGYAQDLIVDLPSNAAAWADFDNDGDPDLALALQDRPNQLFVNENTAFTLVSEGFFTQENEASTALAWGDANGDGLVDLYVANDGAPGRFYQNLGSHFQERSTDIGLISDGHAQSAVWIDFDRDLDLDLFVARGQNQQNQLFENKDGLFADVSEERGIDDIASSNSASWGDYDKDGDFDLYVSNENQVDLLYQQEDGYFVNVADSFGLTDIGPSRGAAWVDLDSDGDLDLHIVNHGTANKAYLNENGQFIENATRLNLNDASRGMGMSWGDYDADGDLDLYVVNMEDESLLFENPANPIAGTYLSVRPLSGNDGLGAMGAVVEVTRAGTGESVALRSVDGGAGYRSQNQYDVLINGLHPDSLYDIRVMYPGGGVSTQQNVSASIEPLIVQDLTKVANESDVELPKHLLVHGNYPNPFHSKTTLLFDLPAAANIKLEVFDILGRQVFAGEKMFAAGYGRRLEVDTSDWPSGTYLYRLSNTKSDEQQRGTLIKVR